VQKIQNGKMKKVNQKMIDFSFVHMRWNCTNI